MKKIVKIVAYIAIAAAFFVSGEAFAIFKSCTSGQIASLILSIATLLEGILLFYLLKDNLQ